MPSCLILTSLSSGVVGWLCFSVKVVCSMWLASVFSASAGIVISTFRFVRCSNVRCIRCIDLAIPFPVIAGWPVARGPTGRGVHGSCRHKCSVVREATASLPDKAIRASFHRLCSFQSGRVGVGCLCSPPCAFSLAFPVLAIVVPQKIKYVGQAG